jgi:hypothetical protein
MHTFTSQLQHASANALFACCAAAVLCAAAVSLLTAPVHYCLTQVFVLKPRMGVRPCQQSNALLPRGLQSVESHSVLLTARRSQLIAVLLVLPTTLGGQCRTIAT